MLLSSYMVWVQCSLLGVLFVLPGCGVYGYEAMALDTDMQVDATVGPDVGFGFDAGFGVDASTGPDASPGPDAAVWSIAAPSVFPTPSAQTDTSISIRFQRSPDPDLVCNPTVGYEVKGGEFLDWHDVGGFLDSPCDDPDPGYKFSSLESGKSYDLSIRAYRIIEGVKVAFSAESGLTASTTVAI